MKTTNCFLLLALLLAPGAASAQGYYGGGGGYGPGYGPPPPPARLPGGFHDRRGRLMFGFSLGLGVMKENGVELDCQGCGYSPLAGQASGHIGGFVGPRLALMGELHGNIQT